MLWGIASIFLFFWVIGLFFHVMGQYIHLFILLAIATVLINFIKGRSA